MILFKFLFGGIVLSFSLSILSLLICLVNMGKETQDKDYEKAVKTEYEEIKKGNYNFPGIRK